MSTQLCKNFIDGQVKSLIKSYLDKKTKDRKRPNREYRNTD
jgi:hypothetical protein